MKPNCYTDFDINRIHCRARCKYRLDCAAIQQEHKRKQRLKRNGVRIKMASMDPMLAVPWGLCMYQRTLLSIGPITLGDEYDWLLGEEDEYLKQRKMELLKQEVEKRALWDNWEEFLEWVSS